MESNDQGREYLLPRGITFPNQREYRSITPSMGVQKLESVKQYVRHQDLREIDQSYQEGGALNEKQKEIYWIIALINNRV